MTKNTIHLAVLALALSPLILSGCSEPNLDKENAVTSQGTIDLGKIKVGTPDQVFQEASVTFVRDQSPQANSGGKRQYISRPDPQGGQYIVQLKNGSCFEVAIIYKDKPVTREAAEAALKNLLPEGAPPQSRVDEPGKNPDAIYFFGDEYLGDIAFTDKTLSKAISVKLTNIALLKQALADSQTQKEELKPLVTAAEKENAEKAKDGTVH
ncbi:MAG: hypothetical protein JSS86_25780 [Cyanobacteria bacterium SZAS LIN-2]|nr:hypothetical protein [Cyanobacteria bacterium SZAS LIN-3]MBS1999767.1 hypothetical protein [Cyanobacteria bacterium SZAS LIN-2]MBS2007854.1 hypothetical protein [Cyanobacteria bacterium SZAS TMP-1]